MKIKESKSIIIESDNAPLKISGRDGLSAYRVAKFHEKDNENIKHAVYRTPGGAYYNRYYVKDIYGDEDELGNKGVVGPFTSEEDAVARLKDYKKDVVKESYRGRRRIRESKELDRKAFVSLVKLGRNPYDGYSILNDGYFVKRIYAESDEDAIRQFRDYLARKNEGLNRKRSIKEEREPRFVNNRKNAILGRGEDDGFDEYDEFDPEEYGIYKTRKRAQQVRDTSPWYHSDDVIVKVDGGYKIMSPSDYQVRKKQR